VCRGWVCIRVVVVPNVQENYKRKVSKMKRNVLRNVLGAYWCHAVAARSRSSLPKVRRMRKTDKEEKGKVGGCESGKRCICSQLSCTTGGRVERDGEGNGERRDKEWKVKSRTRGRRALRYGHSAPALIRGVFLPRGPASHAYVRLPTANTLIFKSDRERTGNIYQRAKTAKEERAKKK